MGKSTVQHTHPGVTPAAAHAELTEAAVARVAAERTDDDAFVNVAKLVEQAAIFEYRQAHGLTFLTVVEVEVPAQSVPCEAEARATIGRLKKQQAQRGRKRQLTGARERLRQVEPMAHECPGVWAEEAADLRAYVAALRRRQPTTPRTGTRTRGAGRPNGVKGASRRSAARSGSSGSDPDLGDPDEPEPPPRRLCCVCGADIGHKRRDTLTCGQACRMQLCRDRAAVRDKQRANQQAWAVVRVVWTPVRDPVVAEVLRRCGSWPERSSRSRAALIAKAAGYGISLTDSQAGRLISRSERPVEELEEMVAAERIRRDREAIAA